MNSIGDKRTLIIEPEKMRVKVKHQVSGETHIESFFLPDFLMSHSDEEAKRLILNEISLFSSRFF
jgi:hypothetical protein